MVGDLSKFYPLNCVCNRIGQVTKRKELSVAVTKINIIAKCNYTFNTKLPEKKGSEMKPSNLQPRTKIEARPKFVSQFIYTYIDLI